MTKTSIIYPGYYLVVKREADGWIFRHPRIFYRANNKPICTEKRELQYGLTKKKIIIELFRLNAGKLGYYLANMRDRQYYYCGTEWEDVKTQLRSLGIGREDPN